MSSDEQRVTVAGTPIDYRVTRSDDATEPRIDVGIHAITVVLPVDSDIDPDVLISENRHWIVGKKRKYDQYRENAPDRKFVEGEEFPFLGDPHTVTVETIDDHEVADGELRNQRTRWGSCSPNRTLSFNWRLVMAPPDVIDYVVVHELVHLREKNHTTRFWQLVGEYVPEYKQRTEWLERNSSRLIFTQQDL